MCVLVTCNSQKFYFNETKRTVSIILFVAKKFASKVEAFIEREKKSILRQTVFVKTVTASSHILFKCDLIDKNVFTYVNIKESKNFLKIFELNFVA